MWVKDINKIMYRMYIFKDPIKEEQKIHNIT